MAGAGGNSPPEASEATVAWRGRERHASAAGASIRFFKRTYENPRPEVPVANLEFEPTWTTPCHPVLLAITLE